jgi:hypothetical protein
MYETVGEWRAQAESVMADYGAILRLIDRLEAHAVAMLADAIEAYSWPAAPRRPARGWARPTER